MGDTGASGGLCDGRLNVSVPCAGRKMDARWKHLDESCQTVAIGSPQWPELTFPEDTPHPSRAPDFFVLGAWGSSRCPHRRCSSGRRGRPAREAGAPHLRHLEAGSPSEFPDPCTSHFLPQTLLFPVWEHREDFLRPSLSGSGPGKPGASIPMPARRLLGREEWVGGVAPSFWSPVLFLGLQSWGAPST